MNIQCELCREIVALRTFSSSSDGIHIQCGACRGSFFVAARANTSYLIAPAANQASAIARCPLGPACPKCEEPTRSGARACTRCGLAVSKFGKFTGASSAQAPELLRTLWSACERSWRDSGAHQRFLHAASEHDSYTFAAQQYRRAVRNDPNDEIARRGLEQLSSMVTARALATSPPGAAARREPFRGVAALVALLLVCGAAGGVYALKRQTATAAAEDSERIITVQPGTAYAPATVEDQ